MKTDTEYTGRLTGYMRVSTDMQEMDMQRQALIRYGVPPDRIFFDVMTGAKMGRAGLRRAIKAMWARDTLVVWKLDRLGRNTIGALQQIDELTNAGIHIASVTENIDPKTPMGKLMITILAGVAQWERDLIAERTKAGIAAFRERGGKMGQPHPVLDRPWRLAKFDELVAIGAVRVDKTAAGGLPDAQIVAMLNETGKGLKEAKGVKAMSEQSYRNWKSKNFAGYQIPNDDDVIEANSEE
jgi:DNA invertase Pin-like site-specific DNA recombinase